MSKKTIDMLIRTIAVLVVVYALALFWQNRQTTPGLAIPVNTAGLKAAADKLAIKAQTGRVTLRKDGDKWYAGKNQVGSVKISTLLQALEKVSFVRVASSAGDKLEDYGLGNKEAGSLSVYQNGRLVRTLLLGKMATANSFFIKLADQPTVYEAQGDLVFEVSQPISSWTESKATKDKKK